MESSGPIIKRSGGVTAAAVVVFLGSGLFLLLSVAGVAGRLAGWIPAHSDAPFRSARDAATAMNVSYCMDVMFIAWGFATGIGLLRLRAWARASILVIGGLLLVGMGFGAVAIALLSKVLPAVPGPLVVILGLPAVIGGWWIVHFNLSGVRKQFEQYPTTGHYSLVDGSARTLFLKPQPPLSIILIACIFLAGVPSVVVAFLFGFPAVVLGFVIEELGGKLLYSLYLPAILYTGFGLLKLKPAARFLAIALTLLHMANNTFFVLLPGLEERLTDILGRIGVVLPGPLTLAMLLPLVRMGFVVGLSASLVVLWFLVTQRSAFIAQTSAPGA